MANRLLKLVALLFIVYSALGQEYQTSVQYFSQEDGIGDRAVFCVAQDGRGITWVGTGNGLNRYDGHRFTSLRDNANPLSKGKIIGIKKAPDGTLWIQKVFHAVIHFDPVREKNLPVKTSSGQDFAYLELLNPSGESGLIFFRNEQDRIFKLDQNNQITPFGEVTIPKEQLVKPTSWGTLLVSSSTQIVEVGESGQAIRSFSKDSINYRLYDEMADHLVLIPYEEPQNSLEDLYFIKKEGALNSIRLKKEGAPFKISDLNISKYGGIRLRYIKDKKANAYLVVNQGILFFDQNNNAIVDLTQELLSLSNIEWIANQLFVDNQNRLWISTGLGIFLVQVKKHPFKHYLTGNYNSIRSICEISDNRILTGTYKGTVVLDKNSKNVKHDLFEHCMITLTKSGQNTLWGGAHGHYIRKIREDDLSYEDIKTQLPLNAALHLLYFDSLSDQLYIGSEQGLYFLDKESQQIAPYQKINSFPDIQKSFIYHMFRNEDGMWIATNKGMFLLDESKGIISQYKFSVDAILHFHIDSSGDFWLATFGSGLIQWNPEKNTQRQFTTEDGLSHNVIYAVYEDKQGFLWLTSNYGLMRFEKNTIEVVVFLPEDGITHEEFNTWSHCQGQDGRLYFGGLDGFIAFDPEEIEIIENEAPFIITQLQQFDSKEGRLVNKTQNLLDSREIILEPGDKFFTLDFSLLDYSAGNYTYAWKIDGLDDDWTYQTDNRIRINALKYGDFNLQMKAKGYGGQWAKNQLQIPIRVLRPFYLKPWFVVSTFLVAGLIFSGFIRYRTSRLRRNAEKLSFEVTKRTHTISEQNQQLKQAGEFKDSIMRLIAHDLKTPLISLRGLSQKMSFLMKKNRLEEVSSLGETIDQSTKNVTELLDNLFNWALLQKGAIIISPEKINLEEVLEETLDLYTDTAESKSVQLERPHQNGHYFHADKNAVLTILRNLIHNAIKFTPEGGKVKVLSFQQNGKTGFEVRDSGIGMTDQQLTKLFDLDRKNRSDGTAGEKGTGFGLILCKELVSLNRGTIEVESTPGKGTSFFVLFPAG